jgi:hypothetical protein
LINDEGILMHKHFAAALAGLLFAINAAHAQPAEKPSVGKYLADGYEVIRSDFGSPFLQFILKKDKTLVWCSVLVQSGETSSCRTIK